MSTPLVNDRGPNVSGLLEQLASLAGRGTSPADRPQTPPAKDTAARWLAREDELSGKTAAQAGTAVFLPAAPQSLEETHVAESEIEAIILRLMLLRGNVTGMDVSRQVGLPFRLVEKVLHSLKAQLLVVFKSVATLTDYVYEITETGQQRARQSLAHCSYCGAAPVSLSDYAASVAAQSLHRTQPSMADLRRAFADLVISPEMFARLGRAITSGRGLFLHGSPGNGKTSIAERITQAYGTSIWIPRAISVWGEIVRVFDPSCHEELPLATSEQIVVSEKLDHRWVRIRRPTIVVGGELTLESLEITVHRESGIGEAAVQMKSNCGTLVIDDFGRQRVPPRALLNRWIVPLEKRYDYLNLASGRKFCVPFDQFVVFSTNLEPRDLVDEAFLRRIPYKIEVENPSVEQFRTLLEAMCRKQGIQFDVAALDHLIARHYEASGRPMRFCHARDLLHQVGIFCRFRGLPPTLSVAALDAAANDYFSVMG